TPFARMMDDGEREAALQVTQVREQGRRRTKRFDRSGEVGRRVEHEEDWPHRGDGGLELLPSLSEIESEADRARNVGRDRPSTRSRDLAHRLRSHGPFAIARSKERRVIITTVGSPTSPIPATGTSRATFSLHTRANVRKLTNIEPYRDCR